MTIPKLFSINSEFPIRIKRDKLDPEKAKMFNEGYYDSKHQKYVMFARTNYKYLYTLIIDKGDRKTFIQLATPSFKQVLYSIRVLWNAYDGKPYDRHEHPVIMQALDIKEMPPVTKAMATVLEQKAKRGYAKSKSRKRK